MNRIAALASSLLLIAGLANADPIQESGPYKNPNNQEVWIRLVLDQSGSMETIREDTIKKVNEYIESQKKLPGKVYFTLTMFNTSVWDVVYQTPISEVKPLTLEDYTPDGYTALYDAVGSVILHNQDMMTAKSSLVEWSSSIDIYPIHISNKPDKVLIVVMTDGMENSSIEFDQVATKQLIDSRKDEWQFAFLGANMDTWAVASAFGGTYLANNSITWHSTSAGVDMVFDSLINSTDIFVNDTDNTTTDNFWVIEEEEETK